MMNIFEQDLIWKELMLMYWREMYIDYLEGVVFIYLAWVEGSVLDIQDGFSIVSNYLQI